MAPKFGTRTTALTNGMGSLAALLGQSAPLAVTLIGLLLWTSGMLTVDLRSANDLGLISVMPGSAFVGFVAMVGSLVWSAARRSATSIVVGQLVLLIVGLFGAAAMVQDVPGFRVVYRHVGIIDYIARTGTVDTGIDVHFSWPGFFVLGAMLSDGVPLDERLALVNWAPVFFNVLYLPALLLIFAALGASRRVAIIALVVFLLGNWPGQDYYSPQATAYFTYLLIIGILLVWFRGSVERRRLPVVGPAVTEASFASLMGIRARSFYVVLVVALFAALVPMHQLTPFAVLAATAGLYLLGRIRMWALPVAMALMIGIWFSYMADGYLSGRLAELIAQIGGGQAINANVTSRLSGSAEHATVVRVRLLVSMLVWALAGLSWLMTVRLDPRTTDAMLLMVSPFSLLGLQLYGGEMAIRVYFFSLPFAAFLIASLIARLVEARPSWLEARPRSVRIVGATILRGTGVALILVLAASFLVTRYGNLRVDDLTAGELTAITFVNETAEPGSLIVALTPNLPWKAGHYDDFELLTATNLLDEGVTTSNLASEVATRMAAHTPAESYLIVNRGSLFYLDTFGYSSPAELAVLEAELQDAGLEASFIGLDITIYELADRGLVAR